MDVERLFEELTAFVPSMDEEEKPHAKAGLTEEELAIFDIHKSLIAPGRWR